MKGKLLFWQAIGQHAFLDAIELQLASKVTIRWKQRKEILDVLFNYANED